jgi:hypothetical protein
MQTSLYTSWRTIRSMIGTFTGIKQPFFMRMSVRTK